MEKYPGTETALLRPLCWLEEWEITYPAPAVYTDQAEHSANTGAAYRKRVLLVGWTKQVRTLSSSQRWLVTGLSTSKTHQRSGGGGWGIIFIGQMCHLVYGNTKNQIILVVRSHYFKSYLKQYIQDQTIFSLVCTYYSRLL